jgi:hypothetical protein
MMTSGGVARDEAENRPPAQMALLAWQLRGDSGGRPPEPALRGDSGGRPPEPALRGDT